MKIKRILVILFALLPLIVCLITLAFLPDTVPVHYDFNLDVDRYGSKYELLVMPVIVLILGAVMVFVKPRDERNRKSLLNIALGMELFMGVLFYYLLYVQAAGYTNLKEAPFGFERFIMLLFGALFIFMGNLMPTTGRNYVFGLRTSWSAKNSTVWKKSQLFSGIAMILIGVACIILAFVYPNLFVMIGLLLLTGVICTVYSYLIARNAPEEPIEK